ncbi:type 4 pilus major pilin [Pseudomonas iridis]|uniref:type 4 pilus major pilin n=1 Tax=Pseudomonas iridis TaxID=2710587 RepID=UPI001B32F1E6|nr:hypothetical protein [Pseudomonas iridis]
MKDKKGLFFGRLGFFEPQAARASKIGGYFRPSLKLGIYPKSVKVSSDGSSISNVFGGTIDITGESPSSFTVTYTHVPNGEVCANIIRAQKAVGWDSVNTVTYDKDYTITDVVALCGSNGTGTIDLAFVRANTNS